MPDRRVVVHFMHETEAAIAAPLVKKASQTDGTFVGELSEANIALLRQQGIVVQVLDEPPPPRLRNLAARARNAPRMMARDRAGAGPALAPGPMPQPGTRVQYRVRLAGPMVSAWRSNVEAAGAEVNEAVAGTEYRVLMSPSSVAAVSQLPFVLDVLPWNASDEEASEEVSPSAPVANGAVQVVTYDLILVHESKAAEVIAWLEERRGMIAAAKGDRIRFHIPETSSVADDLRQRTDWILLVERFVEPMLHNDRARVILGVDSLGLPVPLTGAGEVVGVADTGIDSAHKDFTGRLASVIPLGRNGDASDPNGHGTHVTGSIAGDGSESGGQFKGVAPAASIVFQSLLDSMGKLTGLPFKLEDLFNEAYQLGARIHNNSWGAPTGSTYRVSSREVDEFVWNKKDMLIVISAGNEGTAADPLIGMRRSQQGFVDWLSIGSPATSKNALTVGASRSDRTSGGYSTLKHGEAWPEDFPAGPIKDEPVSSKPDCMSGFSSRGPCDDYRIKPDVVAPGTDILSCRSSGAPLRNFWGPFQANPKYAFMGGTSMAAPLVSGCAALIREYYRTKRNHSPSAALLKATIINGAEWLAGPDSTADHGNQPNYHQGFGRVDMTRSLPDMINPAQRLEFIDNWQDPGTQLGSDQRRRWVIGVAPGTELRLCLAYTDPPGRSIQNNLNMLVEVPGMTQKLFGNMQVPMSLNQPDATNNVEVLRLPNAPGGQYLIQITATSIMRGPQDFALVATGALTSAFQPF